MKRIFSKTFTPILTLVMPAIIIGLLVSILPGYQLYKSVWVSGATCIQCHGNVDENSTLFVSHGEEGLSCINCHTVTLSRLVEKTMLWGKKAGPRNAFVHLPEMKSAKCKNCHNGDGSYLHNKHMAGSTVRVPIHKVKMELGVEFIWPKGKARKIECSDCHSSSAKRNHSFAANDNTCLRCHIDVHQDTKQLPEFSCRNCHFYDFIR